MNQGNLEITGVRVDPEVLKGLETREVLVTYDFPRIFTAAPPHQVTPRLFCCVGEGTPVKDDLVWISFPISEQRLRDLTDEQISLRETIEAADSDFLIGTGRDPFHPSSLFSSHPELVPETFLPKPNVTLGGRQLRLGHWSRQSGGIAIEFHFLSGITEASESIAVGVLGQFQSRFQRFISWTAHSNSGEDLTEISAQSSTSSVDWSSLAALPYARGSLRLRCVGLSPEKERKVHLTNVLELLQSDLNAVTGQVSDSRVADDVRSWSTEALRLLLRLIVREKLSVIVRWTTGRGPVNSFVMDSRRAARSVKSFKRSTPFPSAINSLTIQLTKEEAAGLRDLPAGEGGFENLLRKLKGNLSPDGVLSLTGEDMDRITTYALEYGEGGWQKVLRPLLPALQRAGMSFAEFQ